MYCYKCGTKIPEQGNFCPKCGTKIKRYDVDEVITKINNAVDHVGDELGGKIDNVVNEVGNGLKSAASGVVEKAEKFDLSQITEKPYVDKIATIAALLPLVLFLINLVYSAILKVFSMFGLISYYFYYGGVFGTVLRVISFILKTLSVVSLLLSACAVGLLVYRVLVKNENENAVFFAIGADFFALLSCLGYFSSNLRGMRWLMLVSVLLGICMAGKVFGTKTGLVGNIEPANDFAALKGILTPKTASGKEASSENYVKKDLQVYEETEEIEAGESYFDGTGGQLFMKQLLLSLVSLITCGIATPWMLVKVVEWRVSHTVIDGRRLKFNGTGGQLFGLWIKWWLLSVITCGIYAYFAKVDYNKWEAKHTAYENVGEVDGIYPYSYFDGNSFEYFGYSVLTGIITGATCGIAYPWMECFITAWKTKSTVVSRDRLFFSGKGGKLFGVWLLNGLLTAVTCGIYMPWAICKVNKFITTHTHVDARGYEFR